MSIRHRSLLVVVLFVLVVACGGCRARRPGELHAAGGRWVEGADGLIATADSEYRDAALAGGAAPTGRCYVSTTLPRLMCGPLRWPGTTSPGDWLAMRLSFDAAGSSVRATLPATAQEGSVLGAGERLVRTDGRMVRPVTHPRNGEVPYVESAGGPNDAAVGTALLGGLVLMVVVGVLAAVFVARRPHRAGGGWRPAPPPGEVAARWDRVLSATRLGPCPSEVATFAGPPPTGARDSQPVGERPADNKLWAVDDGPPDTGPTAAGAQRPEGPAVLVLGPLGTCGWAQVPERPEVVELAALLALYPRRRFVADELAGLLSGPGRAVTASLARFWAADLRRCVGGGVLVSGPDGYGLPTMGTDWAEWLAATDNADGRGDATGLIRGRPLEDAGGSWAPRAVEELGLPGLG